MNCKKGMATFLALAVAANATGAPVHAEGKSFLERIETLERANWTMAPWRNVLNTLGDLPEDIDKLDEFFLQDQYFDGNLTLAEKIFDEPREKFANYKGYNALNVKRTFDGKFNRYNFTNTCKLATTPEEISNEQEAYDAMALEQRFDARFGDVCMSDEAVHEYQQQVAELLEGSWLDLVNGTDLMLHMKDGRVFNCADLLPAGLCKDLIRTFTEEGREAAEKQLRDGIAALFVSGLVLVVASIIDKLTSGAGTTTTTDDDDHGAGGGGDGSDDNNDGNDNNEKDLTFEQKKAKLQGLLQVVENFKKTFTSFGYTGLATVVQTALNQIISNGTAANFMTCPGAVTEENIGDLLEQATALCLQLDFVNAQKKLKAYAKNYTTANVSITGLLDDLPEGKLRAYVVLFWNGEVGCPAPDAFDNLKNLKYDLGTYDRRIAGLGNTIPHLQQARRVAIDINNAVITAGDVVPEDLTQIQNEFNEIEWNVPGAVENNALPVNKLALRLRIYQIQAKINTLPDGDNKNDLQQQLDNLLQQVTTLDDVEGAKVTEKDLKALEQQLGQPVTDDEVENYINAIQYRIDQLSNNEACNKIKIELNKILSKKGTISNLDLKNEILDLLYEVEALEALEEQEELAYGQHSEESESSDGEDEEYSHEHYEQEEQTVKVHETFLDTSTNVLRNSDIDNLKQMTANVHNRVKQLNDLIALKEKNEMKSIEEKNQEKVSVNPKKQIKLAKKALIDAEAKVNSSCSNQEKVNFIEGRLNLLQQIRRTRVLTNTLAFVSSDVLSDGVLLGIERKLKQMLKKQEDVNKDNEKSKSSSLSKSSSESEEKKGEDQEEPKQEEQPLQTELEQIEKAAQIVDVVQTQQEEFVIQDASAFTNVFDEYSNNHTGKKDSARDRAKKRLIAVNKAYDDALKDSENAETILNSLNTVKVQIKSQLQSERSIGLFNYSEDNESSLLTYFRQVQAKLEEMLSELEKSEEDEEEGSSEERNDDNEEEEEQEERQALEAATKNGQQKLNELNTEIADADGKGGEALTAANNLMTELKTALNGTNAQAITDAASKVDGVVEALQQAVADEKKAEEAERKKKEQQALEAARTECKQAIEALKAEIDEAKKSNVLPATIQGAEILITTANVLLNNNDVSVIEGQTQALKIKTNALKQIMVDAEAAKNATRLEGKKTELKTALENLQKTFDEAVKEGCFADKNEDQYDGKIDSEYWAKLAKETIRLDTQILNADDGNWMTINNKADSVNALIKSLEDFVKVKKLRKEQDEIKELVENIGNEEVAVEEVADEADKAKLAKRIDIRIKAYEKSIQDDCGVEDEDISDLDYEDAPDVHNLIRIKAALINGSTNIPKETFKRLEEYSSGELFRLDERYSKGLKGYAKQYEENLDVAIENATNAGQNQEKIDEAMQLKQELAENIKNFKSHNADQLVKTLMEVERAVDSLNKKEVVIEVEEMKEEKSVEKKDVIKSVPSPDPRDVYLLNQIRKQIDWQIIVRPEDNLIQQALERNQQQTDPKQEEQPLEAKQEQEPQPQPQPQQEGEEQIEQPTPRIVNVEQQIEMPLDADGRVKAAQAALQAAQAALQAAQAALQAAQAALQAAQAAFDDGDGDENERIAVIARHLDTVHQLIDQHKNELQLSGSSDDEVMDQLSRIRNKIERFLKALREAAEEEDFTEDDDKGGKDGDNGGNGMKEDEKKEEKDDVNGSDNDQQQNPAPNADQSNLNNNENNEEHSRVDLAYLANVAKHIPECLFTKENLGAAAGVGVAAATSGIPAAIPAAGAAAIGYNTLKCAQDKADIDWERMRLEEAAYRNNGLHLGERSGLSRLNGLDDGEKSVAEVMEELQLQSDKELKVRQDRFLRANNIEVI